MTTTTVTLTAAEQDDLLCTCNRDGGRHNPLCTSADLSMTKVHRARIVAAAERILSNRLTDLHALATGTWDRGVPFHPTGPMSTPVVHLAHLATALDAATADLDR